MSQLEDLLQRCTVKLTLPGRMGWGTGFFVATGWILTCAHVVREAQGQAIAVRWQQQENWAQAVVEKLLPDPYDLVLLRVTSPTDANPPCVYLDEAVESRDPLYLFGYPDEGDRQGEPRTFNCDGRTGGEIPAILFNLGQVRPGMSGSPLLNQRTGMVCGMVKFTRDRSFDLGGGAIPTRVILEQLPELRELQREFHGSNWRWVNLITMQAGINFQPYLQAILANEDYREWQEVYTPTTVEDRQRMPAQETVIASQPRFSSRLKLRAETVKPKPQMQGDRPRPDGSPEPQERVEQWDVLAGLRNYAAEHVVLIGKPGSGKSTSLERLLWEEAEKALQDPNARIPVLVKLRRCTGTIEGLIRDFLVGHQVVLEIAQIEELLHQGKFLLLLDGLNELPEPFKTEVANFRDRYHRTTPMVFSTRDLGGGGTLGIEKTLKMLPLTEPQMREFARGYLGEEGDRLFQQLKGDRLRKFAETPLLLWMLCRVFAEECIQAEQEERTPKLPENLGLAFREFTQLYDQGTDEHQAIQEDAPVDSRDQWPKLLRHLAFVMIQGKTLIDPQLSIPREEAEDCLTVYLRQVGRSNPRKYAERWLKDLLTYHLIQPVIQPNSEEHIEFCHQLIQEYYAAEYLLRILPDLSDEQLKREYLNYLKWTEPMALMLALADDKALAVVEQALDVDLMLGARLAGEVKWEFQRQTVDLVDRLAVPDWLKARLLGETRSDFALPRLREFVVNNDADVRGSAVEALGEINCDSKTICEILIPVLDDEEIAIALTAESLLKNLNPEEDAEENTIYELIKTTENPNLQTPPPGLLTALEDDLARRRIANAFNELITAVDMLKTGGNLSDGYSLIKNPYLALGIAEAFTRQDLNNLDKAISLLLELLRNEDSFIRGRVVKTFVNFKNVVAVHILPNLLKLLPTGSGKEALQVILTIQANCQFYNYEIHQKAQIRHTPGKQQNTLDTIATDIDEINQRTKAMPEQPNRTFHIAGNYIEKVEGDYIEYNYAPEANLTNTEQQLKQLLTKLRTKYPDKTDAEIFEILLNGFNAMPTKNPQNWQQWKDLLSLLFAGGFEAAKLAKPEIGIPIEILKRLYEIYDRNRKQLPGT